MKNDDGDSMAQGQSILSILATVIVISDAEIPGVDRTSRADINWL